MKTKGSALSRRLRAGVSLRALAAGSASTDDLRSANNPGALIGTRYFPRCLTAAFAALGLMVVAPTSPSHAQALETFAVLAGQTVTNTGPTVLNGNLGVWPGTACTGFTATFIPPCSAPPGAGSVTPPFTIYAGNAVAQQAQGFLTAAYLSLQGQPVTLALLPELGGQNLGPGVYSFAAGAQLTGNGVAPGPAGQLTLSGPGVYIFQIPTLLNSSGDLPQIVLTAGATAGNVFFVVDTATLGVGTSFQGSILALQSISLGTGTTMLCGAALARNGSVTLDTNTITICSSSLLANAFTQFSGEVGTVGAEVATQAMTSFLSLLTNPFADNRVFAPESPPPGPLPVYKAPVYLKAPLGPAPDPRRWGIWGAAYGGYSNTAGDALVGSHATSGSFFGYAAGLDYRITPNTVAGFALGGGGTRFGLSDNLGGGRSDMFQVAVYSTTWINAAYVSTALAYAWHQVSTERDVTFVGTEHLTGNFSANSVGARIEGGYRFAIPGVLGWPGRYGFTPYAAAQAQIFRTPFYSEISSSSLPGFALAYDARTTTVIRTELGARFDWSIPVDYSTTLALRTRVAWAHDHWPAPNNMTATLVSDPTSSFTVIGAAPASDLLLASAGAEILYRNGVSLAAWFDGEFAGQSQKYAVTGRLRYTW